MSEITLHEAREALVAAGITGPHQSHSRNNNLSKITAMIEGEVDGSFGLSGLDRYSAGEVLSFLAELTGCSPEVLDREGFDTIDPDLTVDALVRAGRRLGEAARRGASLLAVTGHPTGMLEHHIHVVEAYRTAGGKILQLREEEDLDIGKARHVEVRYIGGVGCLADWGNLKHTHSAAAMEALLAAQPWPDIVLGDHGFAGAAIERGIPTIAVMDINDPALAVAWAASRPTNEQGPSETGRRVNAASRPTNKQGPSETGRRVNAEKRDVLIVPMDDNRPPRNYEPAWRLVCQEISKNPL